MEKQHHHRQNIKKITREVNFKSIMMMYEHIGKLSSLFSQYVDSEDYKYLFHSNEEFMQHPLQLFFQFQKGTYDILSHFLAFNPDSFTLQSTIHDVTELFSSATRNTDIFHMRNAFCTVLCKIAHLETNTHEFLCKPQLFESVFDEFLGFYNKQVALINIHRILVADELALPDYAGSLSEETLRKGLENLCLAMNVTINAGNSFEGTMSDAPNSATTTMSNTPALVQASLDKSIRQGYSVNILFTMFSQFDGSKIQQLCDAASFMLPLLSGLGGGGRGGGLSSLFGGGGSGGDEMSDVDNYNSLME